MLERIPRRAEERITYKGYLLEADLNLISAHLIHALRSHEGLKEPKRLLTNHKTHPKLAVLHIAKSFCENERENELRIARVSFLQDRKRIHRPSLSVVLLSHQTLSPSVPQNGSVTKFMWLSGMTHDQTELSRLS